MIKVRRQLLCSAHPSSRHRAIYSRRRVVRRKERMSSLATRARGVHSRTSVCQHALVGDPATGAHLDDEIIDSYLQIAEELADAAAAVTIASFKSPAFMKDVDTAVESKADKSPVTFVDREAESKMREVLERCVPEHGIYGEEFGVKPAQEGVNGLRSPFVWVLDPIDGTKSFITGKPLYTTLICLTYDNEPIIGIIDQPVLKERWVGVVGRQTTLNGKEAQTRCRTSLIDSYLYATSPHMFSPEGSDAAFERLRRECKIALYGCDAYAYGLLSSGCCDIVAEADLMPYDYLALVPVIKGAGGTITDWNGGELALNPDQSSRALEILATGDKEIHKAALHVLSWAQC